MIANETVGSELLELTIHDLARGARDTRVLVVAPALNTRLRHWLSDSDAARDATAERLRVCLDRLARNVVERVERRFGVPVVHLVVDRAERVEEVAGLRLAAA